MLARGQQSLIYRSDVRIFLFVMLSATSAFITGCAFQRSLNSTTCSVGLSSSHATETTAHWAQKYGPADPVLSELLKRIAINGDVIAAVSNHALMSPDGKSGMLRTWIDSIRRLKITNFFVIAIDDKLAALLEKEGVPYWRTDAASTADTALSNHGISARKFQLIKEVLKLGYNLMLSDVDIVVLQNPFDHLVRDEDVEGLSDGFDPNTAYMYNDVFDDAKMGWSRYAHTMRIFVLNSGLFYLRPSDRTIDLMDRITARLNKSKEWDQAVFNEEIWFPSSPKNKASHVTVRVLDIYDFVNSKTLFQTMRHEPRFKNHLPVMIHVNYHPDKEARMIAIWKYYVEGDKTALDRFPLGVGVQ